MSGMHPPGSDVLRAFGVSGPSEPLPGGQGRTYAVGEVVLRPADSVVAAEWIAEVTATVREDGFRVPRPRPARDGRGWVVDGWTAWERAAGEQRTWDADWPSALEAAVRFHRAVAAVPRPAFPAERDDVFAQADRMTWGELALPSEEPLGGVLHALARHRTPVEAEPQLVHGDMAGNLLWCDGLAPAVIDLSPYWRPAGLGPAQLVTDAVLWYGADVSLADRLADRLAGHLAGPEARQLVLRAVLFRLAVDALLWQSGTPGVRWDRAQVGWDLEHARPLVRWATGEDLPRVDGPDTMGP
jgi:uncharacterized protein (TIGR02569 family)